MPRHGPHHACSGRSRMPQRPESFATGDRYHSASYQDEVAAAEFVEAAGEQETQQHDSDGIYESGGTPGGSVQSSARCEPCGAFVVVILVVSAGLVGLMELKTIDDIDIVPSVYCIMVCLAIVPVGILTKRSGGRCFCEVWDDAGIIYMHSKHGGEAEAETETEAEAEAEAEPGPCFCQWFCQKRDGNTPRISMIEPLLAPTQRPQPKPEPEPEPEHIRSQAASGPELHVTYAVIACMVGFGGFVLTVQAAYADLCGDKDLDFQRWPSTVSELNSNFTTGLGRFFFGSMLMTSTFLLMAKVPYHIDDTQREPAKLESRNSACAYTLDTLACCCSAHICNISDSKWSQNALMHARQFVVPLALMAVAFFPTINTTTASDPNQEGLKKVKDIHLAAAALLFGVGTVLELLRVWSMCPYSFGSIFDFDAKNSATELKNLINQPNKDRNWWRRALMGWFMLVTLCSAAYSISHEMGVERAPPTEVKYSEPMLSPVGTPFCDLPNDVNIPDEGEAAPVTGDECEQAIKELTARHSLEEDVVAPVNKHLPGLRYNGCFYEPWASPAGKKRSFINTAAPEASTRSSTCFKTRVRPDYIAICNCTSVSGCTYRPQHNDDRLMLFVREVMLAMALLSNYLMIALGAKTEREINAGKIPRILPDQEDNQELELPSPPNNETHHRGHQQSNTSQQDIEQQQDSSCCGCSCEPYRRQRSRNVCVEACIDGIWIFWLLASQVAMTNLIPHKSAWFSSVSVQQAFTLVVGAPKILIVLCYYVLGEPPEDTQRKQSKSGCKLFALELGCFFFVCATSW